MRPALLAVTLVSMLLVAVPGRGQITVSPSGVNVNAHGATTVFLSYGALGDYVPVEAFWCGELVSAAPDLGSRCDPVTLFGQQPIRYDLSTRSGTDGFTDIMSIPPSVARRAYQAAQDGKTSSFFYVRRFESASGAPDQFVEVTCRLTGGGARTPLSLLDVTIGFDVEAPVLFVRPGEPLPELHVDLVFNGTGSLQGRWEVVRPGEEPPSERDLLPAASLPREERHRQRRYTSIERFHVFLEPTGTYRLAGPDPSRIPTDVEGTYLLLLRFEATDDKEGDSDLGSTGSGGGIVHSGGVAGFPMPTLRYVVGSGGGELAERRFEGSLVPVFPEDDTTVLPTKPLRFEWQEPRGASFYRLQIQGSKDGDLMAAYVRAGEDTWDPPPWLVDRLGTQTIRWRVEALDGLGDVLAKTAWRRFQVGSESEP